MAVVEWSLAMTDENSRPVGSSSLAQGGRSSNYARERHDLHAWIRRQS